MADKNVNKGTSVSYIGDAYIVGTTGLARILPISRVVYEEPTTSITVSYASGNSLKLEFIMSGVAWKPTKVCFTITSFPTGIYTTTICVTDGPPWIVNWTPPSDIPTIYDIDAVATDGDGGHYASDSTTITYP